MIVKDKNQNDIMHSDLINSFEIEYIFDNKPIKRFKNKPTIENINSSLENLKSKILNINNCDLKKNAKQIVFSDGDFNSSVMIVGEGPGQKEDEIGKPFVGDAGQLLNKMLNAINIKRENIYITNVVNYRPPNNRKPEPAEINRYSEFLRENLWKPLSGSFAQVRLDRKGGDARVFCCIQTKAMDWIRIGSMLANNGKLDGVQVISEKWINIMRRCNILWQIFVCSKKFLNNWMIYCVFFEFFTISAIVLFYHSII